MERERTYHGRYPGTWQELDWIFMGRPGRGFVRPARDQGASWRPPDAPYTYVIREASATGFRIEAQRDGIAAYEVEQGMEEPRSAWPFGPLLVGCTGTRCDGYGQGDEWAARVGKDPSLAFHATFDVISEELVLRYQVENRSARDAYLLNALSYLTHRGYGDPDEIFVHLERDTRTVWLNKRVPALPEGGHAAWLTIPGPTPIRAGATFREEVHVPLPIEEIRGPDRWIGRADRVHYDGVRFTVQYYFRTEGMTEEARTRDGTVVFFTRRGAPLTDADHGFLETDRVPMRLPVLQRPDTAP